VNFKELKYHRRKLKYKKFTEINSVTITVRLIFNSLGFQHLMPCFKSAWDIAFTSKHNIDGWMIEDTILFTKRQLWLLRGISPPNDLNIPSFTWASSEASNPKSATMLPLASFVNVEASPASIDIHLDQPSSISRQQVLHMDPEMPNNAKEAFGYLAKPSYAGVGVLDAHERCFHHYKAVDAATTIIAWRKANVDEISSAS
jgi:hypothetical protein